MEPEYRLGNHLREINGCIKTYNVTEFMPQSAALLPKVVGMQKVDRKIDATPHEAPHKRLTNILHEPNIR